CAPVIGHVKQRFLANYDIVARVRQRDLQNIAFNDAHILLQPYKTCQVLGPPDSRRSQLYAGDVGTVTVSQVTCRTAQPCAEIDDAGAFANARSLRQRVIGVQSTAVILVVRKQFLGRNVIEMPSARIELGQNDLGRDWMPFIEVDHGPNLGSHEVPLLSYPLTVQNVD